MRSSSRRSLRRSSRTPREQFIAPAGVAAGGPFLPSGFLLPVFPFVGFLSLCLLSLGFLSWDFLSLCLPERSRLATLLGRSIFRPFFGRRPSENGRAPAARLPPPRPVGPSPPAGPLPPPVSRRPPAPPGQPSPPWDRLISPRDPRRPRPLRLPPHVGFPPPAGPFRSAGRCKLRRLSPPRTPVCSGRIGIDLRCTCLAVGAAGRGACV